MPYSEASTSFLQTTDAEFRVWCQALHDRLSAVGCVQTSDTGQINLSTVSVPGTSTYAGYEIWRFDDADQATVPVFFKVEYGKGTTATRNAMRVTVGTGSDGAGNISDASTAQSPNPSTSGTSGGISAASLFDGELLLLAVENTSANDVMAITLGRMRKPTDGTLVGAGALYICSVSADNVCQQRIAGTWTSSSCIVPRSSVVNGGAVLMGRPFLTAYPQQAFRCALGVPSSLGAGDSGNVAVDGVTATFKRLSSMRWLSNTSGTDIAVRTA